MKTWRYPSLKHVRKKPDKEIHRIHDGTASFLVSYSKCIIMPCLSVRILHCFLQKLQVSFRKYKENFIVEHMLNFELAKLLIIVTLRYVAILFYFCVMLRVLVTLHPCMVARGV